MTLKERQWQVREDAILDAAYELMAEGSYTDMNMDALATRIGISKATLYQHFASKEEVAVEVSVRLMKRGADSAEQIDRSLPAIDRIEQMLRNGLQRRTQRWGTYLDRLPLNITQHPRFVEHHERIHTLLAELIERAQADGDISPVLSATVVERIMSQLFHAEFDDLIQSGQCSPEEAVETMVAVVMNGIRTHRTI